MYIYVYVIKKLKNTPIANSYYHYHKVPCTHKITVFIKYIMVEVVDQLCVSFYLACILYTVIHHAMYLLLTLLHEAYIASGKYLSSPKKSVSLFKRM